MTEESCRKRLRDEGSCPICLDYLTDPVTLDCGHNFCYNCIDKCWRLSSRKTTCPQCRGRIWVKKLRPNSQLANMVEIARDLSDLLKHRGAFSMEEAERGFAKDRIDRSLEILRKERENILVYKAKNEKENQDFLKKMEAEREKTAAAFSELHQFLEEQETYLLAQMQEVEKEIARRRDEEQARLSQGVSSFDKLMREIEEKQQHSANEVQNIGNILERILDCMDGDLTLNISSRCQTEPLENPGPCPAALKWRIYDIFDINPFLDAIMKEFKGLSRLPEPEKTLVQVHVNLANVTLDPDTAHPQLILSEDHKSVREGDEQQVLPDNPERFDHWHFVLGCEEFTTGRHFWDVDVDVGREEWNVGREKWAVGVATESVWRKDYFKISPEEGIWDLGKWDGEYRVSDPLGDLPLFLSQEVKKIRVTVNCDGGRVAFLNADTGAELYVYSDTSLCRETLLPFFWVSRGVHLTLLS
ncbi:E3 ubiquitin-protein ligase TRIM11-like [Tiliqua scincoides]|uniref:E3 ubiquitin-protein ligase TRIM11-like n=1 Tax=Tiliqua scincoides TaxID=71010 RepID=UPI0034636FC9